MASPYPLLVCQYVQDQMTNLRPNSNNSVFKRAGLLRSNWQSTPMFGPTNREEAKEMKIARSRDGRRKGTLDLTTKGPLCRPNAKSGEYL